MKLDKILGSGNILDSMTKEEKSDLQIETQDSTKVDTDEHESRVKVYDNMMKASRPQVDEPKKEFPWEGASNVKYPLILTEANTAGSMLSTAIMGDEIVKGIVIGADEIEVIDDKSETGKSMQPLGKQERADRVAEFTNYLLKYKIPDWEKTQDYMLQLLAFAGAQFKKTYWCPLEKEVKSELINFKDIVISNAVSLESAERITHKFTLTRSEIIGRQRAGLYSEDVELGEETEEFQILETHMYYDLDEDDIKEPYILTHIEDGDMLSLQKRFDEEMILRNDKGEVVYIEAEQYFTDYGFIRDSANPIYDIGFGQLLLPLNQTINTVVNQLLDAGTLANTSGGLISGGAGLKSGNSLRIKMGEYKVLNQVSDIKNNIMEISGKEPSPTLFQLMGVLTQAATSITAIKNLNPESIHPNQPATTTLLMLEQGLNEFKAIYKRIHRSLQSEIKKILYLETKYGDVKDYLDVMDFGAASAEDLEKNEDYEIVPVNSSKSLTSGQTMMRANAVYEMAMAGNPYMDVEKVTEFRLKAIGADNPENLMQEPPKQEANPVEEAMTKNQIEMGQVQVKLLDAQAQSILDKSQIDKLTLQLKGLTEKNKARNDNISTETTAIKTLTEANAIDSDTKAEKDDIKEISKRDLSGTLSVPETNPFGGK